MSSPEPAKDNLIGVVIDGTTEIIELIGRGGSGSVYKGRQLIMERDVAVKVIHLIFQSEKEAVKRFQREARVLSSLDHPGLVKVFSCGILADKMPYMIMELLTGETLRQRLDRDKSLPIHQALPIFQELCQALAYSHGQGLIHRDLKPANVFLVKTSAGTDQAKILDFGIAKVMTQTQETLKITATGHLIGSPAYMSPEQCQGADLDQRSDIYSLGCLMYECLSGAPPFSGETPLEVLYKQVHDSIRDTISLPDGRLVSPLLARAVHKALCKDPAGRYAKVEELEQDLAAVAKDPQACAPAQRSYLANLARNQTVRLSALLLVLLAVAGLVTWRFHVSQKEKAASAKEVTSVNALRMAAQQSQMRGRAKEALEKLEQALKLAEASGQGKSVEQTVIHIEMVPQCQELRRNREALAHVQAAFAHLPATMRSTDLALQLCDVAVGAYASAGDVESAARCADRSLELVLRQKAPPNILCLSYLAAADSFRRLGELDKTSLLYDKAAKILASNPDISEQFWPRLMIAKAEQARNYGDLRTYERQLLQAHAAALAAGDCDFLREKDISLDLARLYNQQCRLGESNVWLEKTIAKLNKNEGNQAQEFQFDRRAQQEASEMWCLHGTNLLGLNRVADAKKSFQNCLRLAQASDTTDSPYGAFEALEGLSICACLENDLSQARHAWQQAQESLKTSVRRYDLADFNLYQQAAALLNGNGYHKESMQILACALALAKQSVIEPKQLASLYSTATTVYRVNNKTKEADETNKLCEIYVKIAQDQESRLEKANKANKPPPVVLP